MRKRLVVLLAILCIVLAGFVIGVRMRADREGPVISFEDDEFIYTDGTSEEELLEGVTAEDAVDGDVSDTITLESVYPVDDETVVAVYVAKDSKNNITKVKREMKYSNKKSDSSKEDKKKDSEKQEEQEAENTPEPTVAEEPSAEGEEEEPAVTPTTEPDTADGAETNELAAEEQNNVDQEAEEAKAQEEAKAAQMPEQSPRIYLSDYLIRIKQGDSIDRLSYVKEIQDDADNISELWHYISIDGTVDVNTPGTYELTYYVIDSNNNESNRAILKVIVE